MPDISSNSISHLGPAFLVYLGCLDPGRWATAAEAGSRFGLELVWVLIAACSFYAFLQSLSSRLRLATGRNLAQICCEKYPKSLTLILWFQCELSILLGDLSMVLGIAMTLNALLGLSMTFSVIIAAVDSMIFLLVLPRLGLYKTGIFIASVMGAVILSFTAETLYSNVSSAPAVLQGLIPRLRGEILYVAAGIIGSNVIPSNIYLQSALFECENFVDSQKSTLLHRTIIDISLATGVLFLVNFAVMSSAAATFYNSGYLVIVVQDAQALMEQVLSSSVAPAAFGFALICAGHLSTLSGTMAGHVAVQSFLGFKLPLSLHRILIGIGATIVALFLIWCFGSEGVYQILIFSQVILALQLPFFIVPLLKVTSSGAIMGNLKNSFFIETVSWICTGLICIMDVMVIFDALFGQNDEYMMSETMNFMRDLVGSSTKWGEAVSFFLLITALGLTTWSMLLLLKMILMPIHADLHRKQAEISVSDHIQCIPENSEGVEVCRNHALNEFGKNDYSTSVEMEQHHHELVRDPDRCIEEETLSELQQYNELNKDLCIKSTVIMEEEELDRHLNSEFCKDPAIMYTVTTENEVPSDEQLHDKPHKDISNLLVGVQLETKLHDEIGNDAGIMEVQSAKQVNNELISCTEDVEEIQTEENLSHSADQRLTGVKPYAEVKAEVTISTVNDTACLPCNEEETQHDFSSSIHITSAETFDLSSNHSLEKDVKELHDANVSREVVHTKEFEDEVDNELLDKDDDDDIDGWETLDRDDACQDIANLEGSISSLTLEEPGSGKSFSARSDVSEGSCGGSSGSLSRLGRSARKQFAALLEEFWAKLYDLHGQAVGKPGLPSSKLPQANAFRPHASMGYHHAYGSNSNQYVSRAAQKTWNTNSKQDIYNGSPLDTVGNRYVQTHSSHDRNERRYSSLNIPSSRDNFDSQPATIHGYKTSNYAGRTGTFLNGSDISPFILEQQKPLREKLSHVSSISKLPITSNCAFEKVTASDSSQLKSASLYLKHRLFNNTSLGSNSFYNPSERLDRMSYTGGNVSIWDPLVCRVTGELGISHHEHSTSRGEEGMFSKPLMQQPVGQRGYFGTNASDHFRPQSESAPLSFDEISPSQSRKNAFSIQSSSLWSTQPFEQLFGTSHSIVPTTSNTENTNQDGHLSSSVRLAQNTTGNDHDLEILNALRVCIRKILKMDGSDWLFRIEGYSDEDLIGRVYTREKVLLEADAKELHKSQSRTEQFLAINCQKPLVVKNNPDLTLPATGVPHCGDGCVWNMDLVVSFGVWCIHRILELALMESRPELWGKYTYVLNRLQGILDQAFSKPRTVLTCCICVISEDSDVQGRNLGQIGCTKEASHHSQSWSWECNSYISEGKGASATTFVDIIKVVEMAISSRKGRSGTAAGDVAFPKGKENLASVLKRYKRRLSNKNPGTTHNVCGAASNHRTLVVNH